MSTMRQRTIRNRLFVLWLIRGVGGCLFLNRFFSTARIAHGRLLICGLWQILCQRSSIRCRSCSSRRRNADGLFPIYDLRGGGYPRTLFHLGGLYGLFTRIERDERVFLLLFCHCCIPCELLKEHVERSGKLISYSTHVFHARARGEEIDLDLRFGSARAHDHLARALEVEFDHISGRKHA